MTELNIRALGQTIEHEGKVTLIVKEMPVNCMVMFIDMDTWHKIKDSVRINETAPNQI